MNDSSLARIPGVFFSPVKTFEAIAGRPTWALALLLVVALGVVAGYAVHLRTDYRQVAQRTLEARNVPEDQVDLDQSAALLERFGAAGAVVGGVVIVGLALLAAAVFLVVFRLGGSELSFKASLATVAHGGLPSGLAALLTIPVVLARDTLSFEELTTRGYLASSLLFLAPEDASLAAQTAFASVELFSLWSVVLLAIGYRAVAKVSPRAAAITVVALWLVGVGLRVGLTALQSGGAG